MGISHSFLLVRNGAKDLYSPFELIITMQQVLKRMTLTAVSSTIQHLEHLNLQRMAFASLWCTGEDSNYFVKNELINWAFEKSELHLIDKHEARTGHSWTNMCLPATWSFKRSLFRSGCYCNIVSDIGHQKRFFTTQSSSFSLCCRNFSILSPSHWMLNMSSVSNHIKRNLWDIFKRNHFGDYVVLENVEEVCESGHVPSHIRCPSYAKTGHPLDGPRVPEVKAEWQVEAMRDSCHLARSIMNTVGETIQMAEAPMASTTYVKYPNSVFNKKVKEIWFRPAESVLISARGDGHVQPSESAHKHG
ncbi:uncharacterized protein LOC135218971 [Macrobrachium nipponense]|uniref:uncharacterized protein LOC135218971 n=1 Tax=Macrobrachium nipponense TaxID=159736 RepID=UPI0030C891C8